MLRRSYVWGCCVLGGSYVRRGGVLRGRSCMLGRRSYVGGVGMMRGLLVFIGNRVRGFGFVLYY